MATDLQAFVDKIATATCVISVERLEGGGYGTIRIVAGNRAYVDSIENPPDGGELLTRKFVPNCEYTRYFTHDLNFEDFCYRSAVKKECLHSYIHPDRLGVWLNMTFMPLDVEDGNLNYCTFTLIFDAETQSEVLANVSGRFAADALETAIILRSANNFEEAMAGAVENIRELCAAQFCCVLLVDEGNRTCSLLAESIAEGSTLRSMNAYLDDSFYEIVESWRDVIASSNCLIAKDADDMEVVRQRNPRWYESLTGAFVENIVLFPLKSRDKLVGYIWAVNFAPENSGNIKEALDLETYVLGAEVDNYLLLDQLRVLGTKDMLTGAMNRNEMNNYVDALSDGRIADQTSVGVVFADLNGLKLINDEEGHVAGDRLLKDAAQVLFEVFEPSTVFRAGGDEFVAIALGVTESSLNEKISTIQEASAKHGHVSFALGSCIEPDCKNVRRALQVADKLMYADKGAYYAQPSHAPRSRRRAE